ncbi:MAG TPA: RimK/LysX family protein [Candidatus Bathyarchaeia archaeon]|nr:RimK/LysX family protein [Candidatus Bathyarchaeia archaeon]
MTADNKQTKGILGRVEHVALPELGIADIAARIDTGARTSSIWATGVYTDAGAKLHFTLLDTKSEHYTGHEIITKSYTKTVVASSNGATQERYKVKLLLKIKGRNIRASFTLADRSSLVYPVLIGRSVLRGKFVVDVEHGKPHSHKEKARTAALRKNLKSERSQS